MALKRKFIIFFLAFVCVFAAARYFQNNPRLAEASAKVRIETRLSDTGESLLLTQAKGITQQTTMQELLRRLGRQSSSAEKNQQEILEIQKHLQVTREGNSEIFDIRVNHPDPKWAREIASQLAQSFQAVELLEEKAGTQAEESSLERQVQEARNEITELEATFRKVQNENRPSEVDNTLLDHLREKQSRYDDLSKTYTAAHPDMIELQNEIESLKAQINDGPPIDLNAVKIAENNLRDADARYRQLRQKLDDSRLLKGEISGRVKILEISSSTVRKTKPMNPVVIAGVVLIALLVIVLRVVSR